MSRALAIVGCLALAGPGLSAQDLAVERARVLRVIGNAETVDVPLFPPRQDSGVVFRQPVTRQGAESLRLRFSVLAGDPDGPSWGLRALASDGSVSWSTWAQAESESSFWSDELPGGATVVELTSLRPGSPVRIRIDRVAVMRAQAAPVSIVGPNQLAAIGTQAAWVIELGHAVARLRYVGDDDKVYVCSGFLLTSDLLLTNQHCLATEEESDSALVDFDFDVGTVGEMRRLSALLATDFDLDYAVARLKRSIARPPLRLDFGGVSASESLVVIQHPGGEPKQVSILDCRVAGVSVPGRGGATTDFGHSCDTLGGSSGSPVLARDRRTVVGLHHLGFEPDDPILHNRAVHLVQLLADLDPALRAEIEAGQPPAPPPP